MMRAMGLVLGDSCEIILEGLIGVMTMMERRKGGHDQLLFGAF